MVRGFPLGVFQAVNTGKVVTPYDRDEYRDWDHVDFIIDAPLSTGSSGSPVLAVSTRTGEYELVGVFHAGYVRGNALNAVVGIEQLRDLMFTLKRSQKGREVAERSLGPDQRTELERALMQQTFIPYIQLGPLAVALRRLPESVLFEVFTRRFPLDDRRVMVIEDRPVAGGFGAVTQVWFGNERGFKVHDVAALDGETQAQLGAVTRRLRSLAAATLRYRAASERAASSREALAERAAIQKEMAREASGDQDTAQLIIELAERLSPRPQEQAQPLATVLSDLSRYSVAADTRAAPLPTPTKRQPAARAASRRQRR
jgi:serine protease Do